MGKHGSERRWAAIAGVAVIVGGVGLMFIHYVGGRPHGEGDPEGWFASIGFAAPLVAAGVLAVLGSLLGARWQWWSAGVAVAACSIVSIVMFPLLVPGVALIVAGLRSGSPRALNLCGAVFATVLIAVFGILVLHQDPATWEAGSSSNIITAAEATVSVAVSLAVLVLGAAIALATRPDP